MNDTDTQEAAVEEGETSAEVKQAAEDLPAKSETLQEANITTESQETEEEQSLELSAQVSAALFVSAKPLTISELAEASGRSEEELESVMEFLMELYTDEVNGIALKKVQGGYQLRSAPGALPLLRKLIPPKAKKFSKAAAETLAVIAYKQPVQRAEIEAIRGVDALPTLKTLLDAKVVRVIGRENEIGKPVLYATTEKFLERFGLKDLSELPTPRELAEIENDPGESDSEQGCAGEGDGLEAADISSPETIVTTQEETAH
jgi:segregation and condensation protein B